MNVHVISASHAPFVEEALRWSAGRADDYCDGRMVGLTKTTKTTKTT
jgi:hypothetical protein